MALNSTELSACLQSDCSGGSRIFKRGGPCIQEKWMQARSARAILATPTFDGGTPNLGCGLLLASSDIDLLQ